MMSVEILYKTTDITYRETQAFFEQKYHKLLGELPKFSVADTQNEKQLRSKAFVNL